MRNLIVAVILAACLYPCLVFTIAAFASALVGFLRLILSLLAVLSSEAKSTFVIPMWVIYISALIATGFIVFRSWKIIADEK